MSASGLLEEKMPRRLSRPCLTSSRTPSPRAKINFPGFGNLVVRDKMRASVVCTDRRRITISARRVLTFKPSQVLKTLSTASRDQDGPGSAGSSLLCHDCQAAGRCVRFKARPRADAPRLRRRPCPAPTKRRSRSKPKVKTAPAGPNKSAASTKPTTQSRKPAAAPPIQNRPNLPLHRHRRDLPHLRPSLPHCPSKARLSPRKVDDAVWVPCQSMRFAGGGPHSAVTKPRPAIRAELPSEGLPAALPADAVGFCAPSWRRCLRCLRNRRDRRSPGLGENQSCRTCSSWWWAKVIRCSPDVRRYQSAATKTAPLSTFDCRG